MENTTKCTMCGSDKQVVMNEEITKKWGFFKTLIVFGLIFVPVLGWAVILWMWFGRTKTETVISRVCQECGNKVVLSAS